MPSSTGQTDITGTQHYTFGIGHPKMDVTQSPPSADYTPVTDLSATSLTLVKAHVGNVIRTSSASAIAITLPSDTVGAFDTDTTSMQTIGIYVGGAGVPTVTGSGATLVGTAPTMAQYGMYGITRVGADTWAWM